MATLVILFWDGSIMYAESPPLTFDLPVIEAEVLDLDSSVERAILPLTGIRQMIVGENGPAPSAAELEAWDRAAFHFTDGQVLRAWVGPEAALGVHGGVWPVCEPGADERRTIAIPYASLTAIYRLRSWERRGDELPVERDGDTAALRRRVRVLAEREVRSVGRPTERRSSGLLGRLRGDRRDHPEPLIAGPEAGPRRS